MSIRVKNVSGEEIPPYGIMLVTGIERLSNETVYLKVDQVSLPPTTAGVQRLLINGPTPIGITGSKRFGHGKLPSESPQWMAYDTADGAPAFGEMWGVEDGSWYLNKNKAGFEIVGLADSSAEIVQASFVSVPRVYFRLTAALSAATDMLTTPATAAAVILKHSTTSAGDLETGQAITVTSRWEDLELDSGKRGYAQWDWSLLEWVIASTECPED